MANETTSPEAAIIGTLLDTLIRLQSQVRLYGEENATTDQTASRLFDLLDQMFEKDDSISVYVARHGFLYENMFIDRSNKKFELFANRFFQHGIASLTLQKGILPNAIYRFLALISRKPSETWDEGGIENGFRLRNIEFLEVREMAEQDFHMDVRISEEEVDRQTRKSSLWERLAMSIVHEQQLPDAGIYLLEGLPPSQLADLTNQKFKEATEAAKNAFARELSRFMLSLKHEKISIYRLDAIRHLAEYVNALTPDIRNLFLNNAFNLNLDADLSEGFMKGLSDQIILDALQNASMGKSYTPPVIMKLLGRLAEERGIIDREALAGIIENPVNASKLKTLFKSDDFDNYVPKQYQNALLNIIKSDSLPGRISEHIEKLKATLELSSMDSHVGDILLQILRGSEDQIDFDAIRGSLVTTLGDFLSSRNYAKISELNRLCSGSGIMEATRSEISLYFSSKAFISTVLDDLKILDKEKAAEISELIFSLGALFVDPLLERLGEEVGMSARHTYLTVLSRMGAECKAKALARLDDDRWFVTRNLLYLLREFGDPAILPQIRRYLEHPHPKVQLEALKACLFLKDAKAVPAILKALDSKDESTLVSAVRLAGLSGDSRVSARLMSLLKEGSLMNYRLEIRKAAAKALVLIDPHQALPVFQNILASGSLFQSRLHDSLKTEIISLLDSYSADVACLMLKEQVKSGSPEVASAAQAAMSRIMRAKKDEQ